MADFRAFLKGLFDAGEPSTASHTVDAATEPVTPQAVADSAEPDWRAGWRTEPAEPAFRFVDGPMSFGDVCDGWTPQRWAAELRRKGDCCEQFHPDTADIYRRWAADIEKRLGNN